MFVISFLCFLFAQVSKKGTWYFQHPKTGIRSVLAPRDGHNLCQRNLKKRCYWYSLDGSNAMAGISSNMEFCDEHQRLLTQCAPCGGKKMCILVWVESSCRASWPPATPVAQVFMDARSTTARIVGAMAFVLTAGGNSSARHASRQPLKKPSKTWCSSTCPVLVGRWRVMTCFFRVSWLSWTAIHSNPGVRVSTASTHVALMSDFSHWIHWVISGVSSTSRNTSCKGQPFVLQGGQAQQL